MSIKSKVFAAVAALTLAGGVGAGAAVSAGAATTSCGRNCIDIFSHTHGTHRHPGFVLDVLRQGVQIDQPVILFRASKRDPAEDFTIAYQGPVSAFAAAGLMSDALALHYGGGCEVFTISKQECTKYYPDDYAYEIEYAPDGAGSGLCVGVPVTAAQGTRVSLQRCGVSARTVWVADTGRSAGRSFRTMYAPLINGSDTSFSHPFVLTYPSNGYPADIPRPQLVTQTLQPSSNGAVHANQEWSGGLGSLP